MRLRALLELAPEPNPRAIPNVWMNARYNGGCSGCANDILRGDKVLYRPMWNNVLCRPCGAEYERTDPEVVKERLVENVDDLIGDRTFLQQVWKYIDENLSDWSDEYKDLSVLSKAVVNVIRTIRALGYLTDKEIAIFRAELRPKEQIETNNFASVGIYWTWHSDSARVYHHDNAYDSHGKNGLVEITFEANAAVGDVDWIATMAQNIILQGEHEVTLRQGTSVRIERVYIGHDEREVNLVLPVHD